MTEPIATTDRQQTTFTRYKWWILAIIAAVLVWGFSSYIVSERLQSFESNLRVQLAEQQALLSTIAETTARNGADAITESIVRDCPIDDRSRFDTLLSSLDQGLQRYELIELEQLFGACGSFYAQRKAVMVARLTREIEVYGSYVTQLSDVTGESQDDSYQLGQWEQLAAGEQQQSQLFRDLVLQQKQIIDTLLDGRPAGSEEIRTILSNVRETKEGLLLEKAQADNLRSELTAL